MRYLLLLSLFLVGCDDSTKEVKTKQRVVQQESNLGTKIVQKDGVPDLYRLEDPERDVICYVPQSSNGISCIKKY
jgi:hypothetical protein